MSLAVLVLLHAHIEKDWRTDEVILIEDSLGY